MPARARRALLAGLGIPAAALATVVATATPAAAHQVDAGELPAPSWLLGYLGAFAVLGAALVLRGSWTTPRLDMAPEEDPAAAPVEAPRLTVGSILAAALLVATVVIALAGENTGAANVAPVGVLVVWWVGLPLLCLLAGNVLRVANPFLPFVAVAERVLPRRPDAMATAPAWTAGAMLWAFRWFYLAHYRPGSPRALATVLIAYALAATLGGWWWGRRWLLTGEGFGALSTAVGGLLRRRMALPAGAVLGLAVAWLGATAFDAVSATRFWEDVLGANTGWTRTFLGTVGFVWVTFIVAAVALGTLRALDRHTVDVDGGAEAEAQPRVTAWLGGLVGVGLLLAAVGWSISHDLTLLLFEGQNFLILLSDPLGRGWDLFGTIDHDVDVDLVQAGWVQVVQLGALLVAHVGAVAVAHDAALARLGRRRGMALTWAVAVVAAASTVAAAMLVLG